VKWLYGIFSDIVFEFSDTYTGRYNFSSPVVTNFRSHFPCIALLLSPLMGRLGVLNHLLMRGKFLRSQIFNLRGGTYACFTHSPCSLLALSAFLVAEVTRAA
jgi:hypothetical protein